MRVIVTDNGFAEDDFRGEIIPLAAAEPDTPAIALDTATPPEILAELAGRPKLALIRIDVGTFADGRGLTLARLLRAHGFAGRLRLAGHVLADQYAMVRRAGADEVQIDAALAARQPEAQWQARAAWRAHDYQARLRGV